MGRLVPAGEGPPRVSGLELGGRHGTGLPVRRLVLAAVKAPELVVQLPSEFNEELRLANGKLFAEIHGHGFGVLVQGDRRLPAAPAFRTSKRTGLDFQLSGVHNYRRSSLNDLHFNYFAAAEGEAVQVGLQG